MSKPTIYVCGAITGVVDLNRPKFAIATKQLRALGYIVINPHEVCEGITADKWDQCMRLCIKRMMDANLVILLDDWQKSRGANIEYHLAGNIGIDRITLENFLKSKQQ